MRIDMGNLICNLRRDLLGYEPQNPDDADGLMVTVGLNIHGRDWIGWSAVPREMRNEPQVLDVRFVFTGNTQVWMNVQNHFGSLNTYTQFYKHLSSHDSCWADAVRSRLQQLEWRLFDEVFGNLPEDLKPRPIDVGEYRMPYFNMVKKIKLKYTHIDDKENAFGEPNAYKSRRPVIVSIKEA
jgi:hypothetical protein